jgi:mono/diheme cytochrome c family protein
MRARRLVGLGVALVVVAVIGGNAAGPVTWGRSPGGPAVEGVEGRSIYLAQCAACHGADRAGLVGPSLRPERLVEGDAHYLRVIRDGRPGTAMPAWGGVLTEEQIAAVLRFLREGA